MPSISVPDAYQSGVDALVHITDDQFSQLLSALKAAKPSLFSTGLASQVAPSINGLKSREVRRIVESLVAMYAVRIRLGISSSEFASGISAAIDDFEEASFSEEDKLRLAERLTQLLTQLLEMEKSLGITSKANDVLTEHEHTFCSARVLTDIRPIFQSDLASPPSEAVVVHTLKIAYHQDREHKEFYVALDSDDIQMLKSAIERAELKDRSAKSLLDKAGVLCLDAEEEHYNDAKY